MIKSEDNNKLKKDINKSKGEEYQCFKDKVKGGSSWSNMKENLNQEKKKI